MTACSSAPTTGCSLRRWRWPAAPSRAVELTNPDVPPRRRAGATFAGRDVFAPVAAHLCNGVDLAELGAAIDTDAAAAGHGAAAARARPTAMHAEVLWVDRFGNCQLNVGPDELRGADRRRASSRSTVGDERRAARRASRTFAELGAGSVGLVLDSPRDVRARPRPALGGRRARLAPGDAVLLAPLDDGGAESGRRVAAPTVRRPATGRYDHR